MKNNIDLFIKYLDNQMSVDESNSFEEYLLQNYKYNEQFKSFKKLYFLSNNQIDLDDGYFSTLLPNAKTRLAESKPHINIRYALILPAILLLVFFLFKFGNTDVIINNINSESLWEVLTENEELTQNIVEREIILGNNYFFDSTFISALYDDEEIILDETVFDYLESHIMLNEINNNLVDSLTQNEFDNLYVQIIDKK